MDIPNLTQFYKFRLAAIAGSNRQLNVSKGYIFHQLQDAIIRCMQRGERSIRFHVGHKFLSSMVLEAVREVGRLMEQKGFKVRKQVERDHSFLEYSISYVYVTWNG
jgi:hypothetical protein